MRISGVNTINFKHHGSHEIERAANTYVYSSYVPFHHDEIFPPHQEKPDSYLKEYEEIKKYGGVSKGNHSEIDWSGYADGVL